MPSKGYKKYKCDECSNEDFCHWIERNRASRIRCTKCGSARMNLMSRKAQKEAVIANRNTVNGLRSTQRPGDIGSDIEIEFEGVSGRSKCGRFIIRRPCKGMGFCATDYANLEDSPSMYTYAAAVAWCEERAKQQQQGGGE